jgi:hypothetical protein
MKTINVAPAPGIESIIPLTNPASNPHAFISNFFQEFGLNDSKQRLWQMMKALLSSEELNHWDQDCRSEAIFFYERMEGLLEANYAICGDGNLASNTKGVKTRHNEKEALF